MVNIWKLKVKVKMNMEIKSIATIKIGNSLILILPFFYFPPSDKVRDILSNNSIDFRWGWKKVLISQEQFLFTLCLFSLCYEHKISHIHSFQRNHFGFKQFGSLTMLNALVSFENKHKHKTVTLKWNVALTICCLLKHFQRHKKDVYRNNKKNK